MNWEYIEMCNRIVLSCFFFLMSEEFKGWDTSLEVIGKRQIIE